MKDNLKHGKSISPCPLCLEQYQRGFQEALTQTNKLVENVASRINPPAYIIISQEAFDRLYDKTKKDSPVESFQEIIIKANKWDEMIKNGDSYLQIIGRLRKEIEKLREPQMCCKCGIKLGLWRN